jgi:predicted secreted protein
MHHQLVSDSNNKSIVVNKDDIIEIQLDEVLTTGYEWAIDSLSDDICKLQSSDYKTNEAAGIGGGGLRTMSFLIIKKGKGYIKLKNWQRWNGDIYKKFEISIE